MGVRESPRCPSFRDPANLHHAPPVFQPVALASVDMIRTLFRGPALPLTKMGANPAKSILTALVRSRAWHECRVGR